MSSGCKVKNADSSSVEVVCEIKSWDDGGEVKLIFYNPRSDRVSFSCSINNISSGRGLFAVDGVQVSNLAREDCTSANKSGSMSTNCCQHHE